MAALDRETLSIWNITDASDMSEAIEEAYQIVMEMDKDGYLSFLVMTEANKNVDKVSLIKIDLSDSFAYELELS